MSPALRLPLTCLAIAALTAIGCGTTKKDQIIVDTAASDVFAAVAGALVASGYEVVSTDAEHWSVTGRRQSTEGGGTEADAQTVTVVVEDWEESTVVTLVWPPSTLDADEVKEDQAKLVAALKRALPDVTVR